MAIKLVVYTLGICLGIGFVWFTAQIVTLGLREFFKKNNQTNKINQINQINQKERK